MYRNNLILLGTFLVFAASCSTSRDAAPIRDWPEAHFSNEYSSRFQAVVGTRGMIVSDDPVASKWGAEVLRKGGNAIDAAVATAYALAVTRPHFASIGGGGFLLYCPAPQRGRSQNCEIIDFRERAPALASRDMFVRGAKTLKMSSKRGGKAVAVPGVVAGLSMALDRFGSWPRRRVLSRPIALAKNGIRVSGFMESAIRTNWSKFNDEARKIFGCSVGGQVPLEPCRVGETLRQKDLARVLEGISASGSNGFYSGLVARKIVEGTRNGGGTLSLQDMTSYQPVIRVPLQGKFRDFNIITMPPPSSGGVTLLQILRYSEMAAESGQFLNGEFSASAIHAISHGMALSFADRAQYIGDPEFHKNPVEALLSSRYLNPRWKDTFDDDSANIPDQSGKVVLAEGDQTTHFSVIDRHGNAVAITTTVNTYFGSGVVPKGTGVVLNSEMDDFSLRPGVPNHWGVVGSEANSIGPFKRPVSSMSPTILRDSGGNARIVLGASGGSKIPTAVGLVLLRRLFFGKTLPEAIQAVRFRHQWRPNKLFFEETGFSLELQEHLRDMGYEVEVSKRFSKINAIERFSDGRVWGVTDPRGEGQAVFE